jgi:APA family basic amino acid/polyamine antiporter
MLSVSTVMVLRHTRPDLHRPFQTPGYPVVPAIFLIGTILLTIAAFVERPLPSLYSLLTILAGIPVHNLMRRRERRVA